MNMYHPYRLAAVLLERNRFFEYSRCAVPFLCHPLAHFQHARIYDMANGRDCLRWKLIVQLLCGQAQTSELCISILIIDLFSAFASLPLNTMFVARKTGSL